MLEVQKYLNSGKTLKDLNEEFGIKCKEYPSGLVTMKYDQINSPKNVPITNECRGLIMRQVGYDWHVVSKSFYRFFNLGECDNIPESWEGWSYLEKADGSLIKIYYFDGNWEISTSGTCYAESNVNTEGYTFRSLVLRTLQMTEEEFQAYCDFTFHIGHTFIFELLSPDNRIVTEYLQDELVMLGIINNETFEEATYEFLCDFASDIDNPAIRVPKQYSATSTEELEALVNNLGGLQEGVVCWNESNGKRIKCKARDYLTAHKIRNNGIISEESICELVVTNDFSEYLVYFPKDQPKFDVIIDKYKWLVDDCEITYNAHKNIESQKDFAMQVKDHPLSGIMFTSRAKKISIKEAISLAKTSMLVKVLLNVE